MSKKIIPIILIALLCFIGCAKEEIIPAQPQTVTAFVGMEDEADLSYVVPTSYPHILVNQLGYLSDAQKGAFFYGQQVPSEFSLVDALTGEVVYTGTVEDRGYSDVYEAYVSYGDFSNYAVSGTYCIEADFLGKSYEFRIDSDLYKDVFTESLKTYYYNRCGTTLTEIYAGANAHNACHISPIKLREDFLQDYDATGGWHQDATGTKTVSDAARVLGNMLLSYEMFPDAFTDDFGIPESGNGIPDILDEAKYEVDWLIKMQNESTGAVHSSITEGISADTNGSIMYVEQEDIESSLAFAFALSKFSFLYQNFDMDYSTEALRKADRAYKYALLNDDEYGDSPYKMAAAAEIYRASMSEECKQYLDDYMSRELYRDKDDEITFFGCVTYLNTKKGVNIEHCHAVIKEIMSRAEDISAFSRASAFSVPCDMTQSNNEELLNNMMILTLVDHVITNHEYDTIIENYLHYFMGRNPLSISYLDNVGTFSYKQVHESLGIMKQFDQDAKLIFMMSKIISNDGFVEEY